MFLAMQNLKMHHLRPVSSPSSFGGEKKIRSSRAARVRWCWAPRACHVDSSCRSRFLGAFLVDCPVWPAFRTGALLSFSAAATLLCGSAGIPSQEPHGQPDIRGSIGISPDFLPPVTCSCYQLCHHPQRNSNAGSSHWNFQIFASLGCHGGRHGFHGFLSDRQLV
jgi:hypothetical protein